MTPFVVDCLQQSLTNALGGEGPADMMLRRLFRDQPSLGRRDRGDIAETVFDVLRNRRLYAHLCQSGEGRIERRLMILSLKRRGELPDHAPRPDRPAFVSPEERAWLRHIETIRLDSLAPAIEVSLPDWLFQRLAGQWGEADALSICRALLSAAPLDLRVNVLKGDRDQAVASLAADKIVARPLALVPTALRVDGKPALERSAAFQGGLVEVQDAGSQVLAALAAPRRGQTVVDFCAGAGGKTLALAAAMRSTGQIYACDVSLKRLAKLKPRLARAGATNVQPFAIDTENDPKLRRLAGRADLVLVDAPCSGTGTLRRNPDLKGRLMPADILAYQDKQIAILNAAAKLVKRGGSLIYATCSLLSEENEAVAAAFEAGHPQWQREPVSAFLERSGVQLAGAPAAEPAAELPVSDAAPAADNAQAATAALATDSGFLKLRPDLHLTDGFFAARWLLPKA